MIPQEKASALVDRMNLLLRSKPSEFELASIRAEITKIENSGLYTDGQELRGILSTIIGDVSSLKKHYDAAIKSSGGNPELILSYATSLSNAFQLKDAVEIADKLVDLFPDDINKLMVIFRIYLSAYNFKSAAKVHKKLDKLGAYHDNKAMHEKFELNNHIKKILSDNNVEWQEVCDRSLVVVEMLKKQGLKVYPVHKDVDEDSISIEFPLDSDLEELIKIDSLISESISNLPYSLVDECVSFTCTNRSTNQIFAA